MFQQMTSKEKVRKAVFVVLTIDREFVCTFHGDSSRSKANTDYGFAG